MELVFEEFGQTMLALAAGTAMTGLFWWMIECASAF